MQVTEQQRNDALLQIERLIQFAAKNNMILPEDEAYTRNALLDLFRFDEPFEGKVVAEDVSSPVEILDKLLDYGYAIGLIEENTLTYRDLLDAKIMGLVMPRPSQFIANFNELAAENGIMAATDYFYKLSIDSTYIRMDRIQKNPSWLHSTSYGDLQITVNLSKPEKDPKEIARLKTMPSAKYPKCLLCKENVGYAGRLNHPARQNLRTVPLQLQNEEWHIQYSPYVYYNEHSIVFKGKHEPMAVTHSSMARLLDFVEQFPHYFIGSNADLPIVGGSILSHDHFQAGRHVFPMEVAAVENIYYSDVFKGVKLGVVKWPMSVIRLQGISKESVKQAAAHILDAWRAYSDPECDILAYTSTENGEQVPHNTITPIARLLENGEYELDLVLRNNRTSEEHPDGIFHPHKHLHHIKKENIGLIEVMGLAVLPGRLKQELAEITELLTGGNAAAIAETANAEHKLYQHSAWIKELANEHGTKLTSLEANQLLQQQVGEKFLAVLEDAGVYKRNEAGKLGLQRFINSCSFRK